MKAVMLMFDSLNRHLLPPYNADTPVHAPNFERLANQAATFDKSYVCSMPCMPARRDFHTGRPNFLHCSWGPLEPFDDSVPAMLSKAGIYTHMDTDHYHYWEDGGATYHNRYDSYQFFRGQEGDLFVGQVEDPPIPENLNGKGRRADWVNRQFQRREQDLPQTQTVEAGLDFIERNHDQDDWFLQIECFDPHEPFVSNRKYKDLYPEDYDGTLLDWPGYREVQETPEQVQHVRNNYQALVSKCDASLGDVLDAMDKHDLWQDTMLIVWTDHGFLLGEQNCWGKNWMPLYEQVAHTPFFMWDPNRPQAAGQRRSALVQPAIDLGPTLLKHFGLEPTEHMLGKPLQTVVENDTPVREAAIFGYHGNRVNITDGRYVYLRRAVTEDNGPLNAYTLMPTAMRGYKPVHEQTTLTAPDRFSFTQGRPLLCTPIPAKDKPMAYPDASHLLFDVEQDPAQQQPLDDKDLEQRLCQQMAELMVECEAPEEQYQRMGLEAHKPAAR